MAHIPEFTECYMHGRPNCPKCIHAQKLRRDQSLKNRRNRKGSK